VRRYLLTYIKYAEEMLEKEDTDFERLKMEHLVQIQFMQHERFIHLIVTCLFAVLMFICLFASLVTKNIAITVTAVLFLLPLIPYIAHYYFMENNVQKLYDIYNRIERKINQNKT